MKIGMIAAGVGIAMAGSVSAQCVDWVNVTPSGSPSARQNHGMAYDGQNLVMFGGYRGGFGFNDETWLWDGEVWTQASPGLSPIARGNFMMTANTDTQRVILFSGSLGGSAYLDDMWSWDGASGTWTELSPSTMPEARYGGGLCYDSSRQVILLYGGRGASGRFSDTWTYDGTDWTQLFPVTSPGPRNIHGMAYDVARDRTVFFGGYNGQRRNDTWEWDGTNWSLKQAHDASSTTQPLPRSYMSLEYDPDRELIMLAAGQLGPTSFERGDETWEWDGVEWTKLTIEGMGIRDQHTLAYDPENDNLVINGGYGGGGGVYADTWVLTCDIGGCYADCDESESLDLFDVLCFLNMLNAGNMGADCDDSEGLDLFDILCFLNEFNAGC